MNAHLIELHTRVLECEAGGFQHLADYWREEIRKFVQNDVELTKEAASLPMFSQSNPQVNINHQIQ